MDKKKAHTKAGSEDNKINFNDNSTTNQRVKVLDYLKTHGKATVEELKTDLDVLAPPARIKELREQGHDIDTVRKYWTSEHGIKHRVGVYVFGNTQATKNNGEV